MQPIHGYDGFQANDTAQLDAMISVVKQFVDAGVTVWLRWGHEFNVGKISY
jgi:N-acetylglucosamine-6-phosphate deacetylase